MEAHRAWGSRSPACVDVWWDGDAQLSAVGSRAAQSQCGRSHRRSFAGFELSQISDSYDNIESSQGVDFAAKGWETSPYLIFLRTIPGRFYPIAMLALQAMLILTQRDFGTMFAAERRVLRTGKVHADSADPEHVRPCTPSLRACACVCACLRDCLCVWVCVCVFVCVPGLARRRCASAAARHEK